MGKRTSVYLTAEDLRRIDGQPGVSLIGLIRDGLSSRENRSMMVDIALGHVVREAGVPPPECDEHGPMTRRAGGGWECLKPHRMSRRQP